MDVLTSTCWNTLPRRRCRHEFHRGLSRSTPERDCYVSSDRLRVVLSVDRDGLSRDILLLCSSHDAETCIIISDLFSRPKCFSLSHRRVCASFAVCMAAVHRPRHCDNLPPWSPPGRGCLPVCTRQPLHAPVRRHAPFTGFNSEKNVMFYPTYCKYICTHTHTWWGPPFTASGIIMSGGQIKERTLLRTNVSPILQCTELGGGRIG